MKTKSIIFTVLISLFLVSCSKPGDITVQKAMDFYQKHDYEKALAYFKQSLEEERRNSDELVYNFIVTIYTMQEDFENAILYQEKALASKKDYRMIISLGMNYHLIQKDDKAEEIYKSAIEFDSKKPEAYAMLGSLYLGADKIDSAIENLEKASSINPKLSVIHGNLAIAYAKKGNFEKSSEELETARSLKCENIEEFENRVNEIKNK